MRGNMAASMWNRSGVEGAKKKKKKKKKKRSR